MDTKTVYKFYLSPENKWQIVFEDVDGKVFQFAAIPPTDGDRTDIFFGTPLSTPGYVYNADAIIIVIKNGEPTLIDCCKKPR